MTTTFVNADFAVPDGTLLDTYSSAIGGAWSQQNILPSLYPAAGSISDFVIYGSKVTCINNTTSMIVGAAGGQTLPSKFTFEFQVSFSNPSSFQIGDTSVFLAAHADSGYDLYIEYDYDTSLVTYSLYRVASATLENLVLTSSSIALAINTLQSVKVTVDSTTGAVQVFVDNVSIVTYTDPSPVPAGGQWGILAYQSTAPSLVNFTNVVLTDAGTSPTPPPPTPGGTTFLSPIGNAVQSFTNNGVVLDSGKLYSFVAGTSTPMPTYSDVDGYVANTNPIVLDSAGRVQDQIRFAQGVAYKLVLKDSDDNLIWTQDNLVGINDVTTSTNIDTAVWVPLGETPVKVSDTSFSVIGNFANIFHADRRVLLVQSSTNYYATVVSASVTSPSAGEYLTTVEVLMDSGTVLTTIESVYYSFLDSQNSAVPVDLTLIDRVDVLETQVATLTTQIAALTASINSAVPAGSIMAWASHSIPAGWAPLNGGTFSRSTALFSLIGTTYGAGDGVTTANLPDVRGLFIRGYDDDRGIDTGRVLGSFQDFQFTQHNHGVYLHHEGDGPLGYFREAYAGGIEAYAYVDNAGGTSNGSETRPKNIAFTYLIRL